MIAPHTACHLRFQWNTRIRAVFRKSHLALWLALLATAPPTRAAGHPFRMSDEEVTQAAHELDVALDLAVQKATPTGEAAPSTEEPRCSDLTFLRRACIDLGGRLPSAAETRDFSLPSPSEAESDLRRAALIDRLLLEPGAGVWRFERLADALRLSDSVLGQSLAPTIAWLRQQVAVENVPLSDLVHQILTAEGPLAESPATGILLQDEGNLTLATGRLAQVFLGFDFRCAHCHDNPYDDSVQLDVFRLAAFFSDACVLRQPLGAAPPPLRGLSSTSRSTLLPGAIPLKKSSRTVRPVPPTSSAPGELWPRPENPRTLPSPLGPGETLAIYPCVRQGTLGVPVPQNYHYRDAKPGEVLSPAIPPSLSLDIPFFNRRLSDDRLPDRSQRTSRQRLAHWWTSDTHLHFAGTLALRLRAWLFEPIHAPASMEWLHLSSPSEVLPPEIPGNGRNCRQSSNLDFDQPRFKPESQNPWHQALARAFTRCETDAREYLRILARTQAYQRQALPHTPLPVGLTQRTAPPIRRLPAEVLWNALASWQPPDAPLTDRQLTADLPQIPPSDHPLRLMGRGHRQWIDSSHAQASPTLARWMQQAPLLDHAAAELAVRYPRTEDLFLTILNRPPTAQDPLLTRDLQPQDLARTLLQTSEFLFYP